MSGSNEKLMHKWAVLKEQLIALCTLNKLPRGNDEFRKFLSEDIQLKNLNSHMFNSICYYILGIINIEERDKLISWPLINIVTNTKFRKGVGAMVQNLHEKYPWAQVKKLQESYFLNPHANQARAVDFMLRLSNLAIHIALDNLKLLFMHSGDSLTLNEVNVMSDVIVKAKEEEEQKMRENMLPLTEFEDSINEVIDKCIALRQENDDLKQQLNSLKNQAVREELVPNTSNIDINGTKTFLDEKLSELNSLNEELMEYSHLSQELLSKLKACTNPLSLSSKDFACENSTSDLDPATSKTFDNLCQFFQQITTKNCTQEEKNMFYEKLKDLNEILTKENKALHSFLSNTSVKQKI